jgi:hypothetical protein
VLGHFRYFGHPKQVNQVVTTFQHHLALHRVTDQDRVGTPYDNEQENGRYRAPYEKLYLVLPLRAELLLHCRVQEGGMNTITVSLPSAP